MKIILLSGGSGKRLWPLSNEVRSKQFLKLLESPSGTKESMIQRVVRQISEAGLSESITIATSAKQIDFIRNQLGYSVDVVTEPERRDTFPAIALACTYLAKDKGVSPDEPIIVMPCDTYTEPSYFAAIGQIAEATSANASEIVLMGITPKSPSSKFGYIVPELSSTSANTPWLKVAGFKEKPNEETAATLIEQGAFWNGGVFAFKLGYLMGIVEKYSNAQNYSEMATQYSELPKISFDYEVVENAPSISMVAFDGLWKDLGTWDALSENLPSRTIGSVLRDNLTKNTHVINELDMPIICAGTENLIIAATSDGILIANKNASDGIKSKVDGLNSRPMFEERRWGFYRVISTNKFADGQQSLTKLLHINADCSTSYQYHIHRSQVWTIINGEGTVALNDKIIHVKRGDTINIPQECRHAVKADTDMEIIEVQSGSILSEDDTTRLPFTW